MSEVRRVLLANGQYIEIVQGTGSSTGAVMSQSAVTTALNGKANTTHTHAASDITSGTLDSARIADSAIISGKLAANAVTTAKVADGSITKAKLASDVISSLPVSSYETVIVTASSDYYTVNGLLVSINGVQYTFNSTGKIYTMIPYEQVYSVIPVSTDALQASGGGTYTASTGNRSITVSYKAKNGVYIEDKQGGLYTTADWSSGNNANANSIVVLSDIHSFRVALQGVSANGLEMNDDEYAPWETYLSGTTNETVAKTDYNGATNTKLIVEKCQPSTKYAAGWCAAYTFPDGKTKGYMPAVGELYLAYQNKAAIDAALSKCGGTELLSSYCWSSTFYGIHNWDFRCFWACNVGNGGLDDNYFHKTYSVCIFGPY